MSKWLLSKGYQRARLIHRQFIFAKAMRKLMKDPLALLRNDSGLIDKLIYGWNNEAWSADNRYLMACMHHACRSPGPFLECGSGLSTILIGAVAQSQGKQLWALEHCSEWRDRVQNCLDKYSIDGARVCHAPIRRFSEFDWYDAPIREMPSAFDLVICDGPPGKTIGGRFGLLPVMRGSLTDACTILLDDVQRPAEQEVVEQWRSRYGVDTTMEQKDDPFIVVRLTNEQSS